MSTLNADCLNCCQHKSYYRVAWRRILSNIELVDSGYLYFDMGWGKCVPASGVSTTLFFFGTSAFSEEYLLIFEPFGTNPIRLATPDGVLSLAWGNGQIQIGNYTYYYDAPEPISENVFNAASPS